MARPTASVAPCTVLDCEKRAASVRGDCFSRRAPTITTAAASECSSAAVGVARWPRRAMAARAPAQRPLRKVRAPAAVHTRRRPVRRDLPLVTAPPRVRSTNSSSSEIRLSARHRSSRGAAARMHARCAGWRDQGLLRSCGRFMYDTFDSHYAATIGIVRPAEPYALCSRAPEQRFPCPPLPSRRLAA